jgi:mRNA interferase RelE/StbE
MTYRIEAVSSRIRRELRIIPRPDRQRIARAVQALTDAPCPPGVKQLEPNVHRLRVGDYRVIYNVFDAEGVILIGRVARRSERTYRGWQRLFE